VTYNPKQHLYGTGIETETYKALIFVINYVRVTSNETYASLSLFNYEAVVSLLLLCT